VWKPSASRYGVRPARSKYSLTTFDPGARLDFTQGFRSRPRSTAFFARSPAATMTEGFEVFVQEVIAAITTAPWERWTICPSSSHGTPAVHVGASATGAARTVWSPSGASAPGSACAGESLAGNDSATAWSTAFP
jgi:hypothetical protein